VRANLLRKYKDTLCVCKNLQLCKNNYYIKLLFSLIFSASDYRRKKRIYIYFLCFSIFLRFLIVMITQ
jgi:hypothetical protein